MLNPKGKTKWPDWTEGFVPTWEGDQWIVEFPDEQYAQRALLFIRENDEDQLFPPLAAAPHPGGSGWYVGEVHP